MPHHRLGEPPPSSTPGDVLPSARRRRGRTSTVTQRQSQPTPHSTTASDSLASPLTSSFASREAEESESVTQPALRTVSQTVLTGRAIDVQNRSLITTWLEGHLEPNQASSIPRHTVQTRLGTFCDEKGLPALTVNMLGRLVRASFTQVRNITCTTDGVKTAHYGGIRWKEGFTQSTSPANDFIATLAEKRTSTRTLRHVPTCARKLAAEALVHTLEEVARENSTEAWKSLFLFPSQVLQISTAHGSGDKKTSLATQVRNNIARRASGSTAASPATSPPPYLPASTPAKLAKLIEAKLSDGDVSGAIRLTASTDTIAPVIDATIRALENKHPDHPEPSEFPAYPTPDDYPPATVTEDEVRKRINSFTPGTAPGLDGLRPQILKELINPKNGDIADRLVKAIAAVETLIISGNLQENMKQVLCSASLLALNKKEGGIRPIAIGMAWRRLASKIVLNRILPDVVRELQPQQLGVGIRNGAEVGAHAARMYYNYSHSEPKIFLKLDFANAFNSLRRDKMLQMVKEKFPQAYPYVYLSYGRPGILHLQKTRLYSKCGLHQGDPLGPALFSLTIHPVVRAINADFNLWYLDDGTIAGNPEQILHAYKHIRDEAGKLGLELNTDKCEISVLGTDGTDTTDTLEPFVNEISGVRIMQSATSTLLGSPITSAAVATILQNKTLNLKFFGERLATLTAHSALYLLRASFSTPRLVFFLRSGPSWAQPELLSRYDDQLISILRQILNTNLDGIAVTQATLPINCGGLGIRRASDLALPCFLSSFCSSLPDVQRLLPSEIQQHHPCYDSALQCWSTLSNEAIPNEDLRGIQKAWDILSINRSMEDVFSAAGSSVDKARILATREREAGAWLKALPSPQLGTHLSNEQLRVACALRLGSNICQPHRCPCGRQVDSRGLHGLSCSKVKGTRPRHWELNDILVRALRSADIPSIKEPPGVSRSDGKHPDIMTLIPWAHGKSLLIDATCADTLCASYVARTSTTPGSAAARKEQLKRTHYQDLLQYFTFIPFAVESLGVFGTEAKDLIKKIGGRLRQLGHGEQATSYLRQRISLAIQRGNVTSILGSLPPGRELSEIYFL